MGVWVCGVWVCMGVCTCGCIMVTNVCHLPSTRNVRYTRVRAAPLIACRGATPVCHPTTANCQSPTAISCQPPPTANHQPTTRPDGSKTLWEGQTDLSGPFLARFDRAIPGTDTGYWTPVHRAKTPNSSPRDGQNPTWAQIQSKVTYCRSGPEPFESVNRITSDFFGKGQTFTFKAARSNYESWLR